MLTLAAIVPTFLTLLFLGIFAFILWLVTKDSQWFNKLFNKATHTKNFEQAETTVVINNIADAESALGDRADDNKKKAEALDNESKVIQDYLKSRDGSAQGDTETNEKEV
jgi:predicted PurR-regulated permease PerM